MGILDRLKSKMQESMSAADTMVDETLPSDEELQNTRKKRRDTADKAAEYLGTKGYPILGAAAGTAIDMSADFIPESREQYKEDMVSSMAPVGSMGRVGKLAGKMPVKKLTLSDVPAGLQQELRASGEKLAEFNSNPQKILDEFLSKEKAARQEAQKALDLRDLNKGVSKAKPTGEVLEYQGTQAQERRAMLDPSKRLEIPTKVADVEKGRVAEASGDVVEKLPEIRRAVFPTFDGLSAQDIKKLKQQESYAQSLLKKKKD